MSSFFYTGSWNLNSGPNDCMAGILPREPSPPYPVFVFVITTLLRYNFLQFFKIFRLNYCQFEYPFSLASRLFGQL